LAHGIRGNKIDLVVGCLFLFFDRYLNDSIFTFRNITEGCNFRLILNNIYMIDFVALYKPECCFSRSGFSINKKQKILAKFFF